MEGVLEGLAKSATSAELLFAVVRRFLNHTGPDVFQQLPLTIARALEDQAENDLPNDLLELMRTWVQDGPPGRDNANFYLDQEEQKTPEQSVFSERTPTYDVAGGSVRDYLNSARGQALLAVFKALKARGEDEARWKFVEGVALIQSDALRVGAVWEVLSLAHQDEKRAWNAFMALAGGRKAVLRSHFALEFLSHSVYPFGEQVLVFTRELMTDEFDNIKQQGAIIACLVALRDSKVDDSLLSELLDGERMWRSGLAEVCSNSVTVDLPVDVFQVCVLCLCLLFSDEDKEVRRLAARFVDDLQSRHFYKLRQTVEVFIKSSAYPEGDHSCSEFLWKYGDLDPAWTLSQVEIILNRTDHPKHGLRHISGEELTRCVLRLYALPEVDGPFRNQAIELFGTLLERASYDSRKALQEWDQGRYF